MDIFQGITYQDSKLLAILFIFGSFDSFPSVLGSLADQLITDDDLVGLYCGGASGTLVASYKYGARSRCNT